MLKTNHQKLQYPKIDLHIHFGRTTSAASLWDIAKQYHVKVPAETFEEFAKFMQIGIKKNPSLDEFLYPCMIAEKIIAGKYDVLRRIAKEYCQERANDGVIYSEARVNVMGLTREGDNEISADQALEALLVGLKDGDDLYNTRTNVLLSALYHQPELASLILDLCIKYKDQGVVGIDIAGKRSMNVDEPFHPDHIRLYEEAARLGIRRTVHAGENTDSLKTISVAVNELQAERIGHGYLALEDETLYQKLVKDNIHFEICPVSSFATGSVPMSQAKNHLLHRLMKDDASFSISTDEPTVTGYGLTEVNQFVHDQMSVPWNDIYKSNIKAAQVAFLPKKDTTDLVRRLQQAYKSMINV